MRSMFIAVGLLVAAGCSGSSAPTPLIIYVTPSPTATPSPAPASLAPADARVLVAGTTVCDFTSDVTTEQLAADLSVYTATMACTDETSDPRVSGRDVFEMVETEFLREGQDINWFRCANQVLTTAGGTWRGECFGSEFVIPDADGLWTSGYSILHGEGAYEGLVYHQQFAQSPWDGDHYVVSGWIEPAE